MATGNEAYERKYKAKQKAAPSKKKTAPKKKASMKKGVKGNETYERKQTGKKPVKKARTTAVGNEAYAKKRAAKSTPTRREKILATAKRVAAKAKAKTAAAAKAKTTAKKATITGKGAKVVNGKANVTREQLKASGLSLTGYMNKWKKSGKRPTKRSMPNLTKVAEQNQTAAKKRADAAKSKPTTRLAKAVKESGSTNAKGFGIKLRKK